MRSLSGSAVVIQLPGTLYQGAKLDRILIPQ